MTVWLVAHDFTNDARFEQDHLVWTSFQVSPLSSKNSSYPTKSSCLYSSPKLITALGRPFKYLASRLRRHSQTHLFANCMSCPSAPSWCDQLLLRSREVKRFSVFLNLVLALQESGSHGRQRLGVKSYTVRQAFPSWNSLSCFAKFCAAPRLPYKRQLSRSLCPFSHFLAKNVCVSTRASVVPELSLPV